MLTAGSLEKIVDPGSRSKWGPDRNDENYDRLYKSGESETSDTQTNILTTDYRQLLTGKRGQELSPPTRDPSPGRIQLLGKVPLGHRVPSRFALRPHRGKAERLHTALS